LRGRGLRLTALRLEVALERFTTVKKPLRRWDFDFMLPHGSAQAVLPVIGERLQRDVERQPFESLALSVRYEVLETTPGYDAQRDFFHSQEERTERLNSAIEQLAEELGKEKVFRAVTLEERLPEKSWKRRSGSEKSARLDGAGGPLVPLRPTRLLPEPLKVEMNREKIILHGRELTIRSRSSVERISTGWLDGLQTRDYFKAETEEGEAFWVFRDGDSYFLHGYFE
jgi:protein ImuB